jgi:hypothetical protein
MAGRCQQREAHLVSDPPTIVLDYEVRSFAVAAIMGAAAFLEARVNEVWFDATETGPGEEYERLSGLSADSIDSIRALALDPKWERSLRTLEKYAETAKCLGKSLAMGLRPGQDVTALLKLRHAFVHFRPEQHWDNEEHALEVLMKKLVPANPLMQGANPWFPHHPLCAGVADWACEKAVAFVDEWEMALCLTRSYKTDLPLFITEE